jgi:hypothetical protein
MLRKTEQVEKKPDTRNALLSALKGGSVKAALVIICA